MKILLIRPRNEGNINTRLPESLNKRQGVLPPLGIAYIAAVLEEKGHTVRILDVTALNLAVSEVRKSIEEFQPDMAGITTMTSTLFGALEAARMAKENGAITVLGGPQLSIYPKETLSYPYVDYGIGGEGEIPMLELINCVEKGQVPDNIRGAIYKKDNDIFVNCPAIAEDLDSLPFPAYHLLPMKRYNSLIGLYPVSTMITTRGCPYKCHFCFKQPSDARFRFRCARNVVDEMELLLRNYDVNEIMFYDDVMTARRSHAAGICEEILSRGLKVAWEAPARVDNVDKELLALMKRAGCRRIRYGVESGDEDILNLMDKKIDLKKVKEVFKMTDDAGIETFAYFMIGYAHENEKTVRKTIDFAKEIDPGLAMFTVVTPYPATPLYELAKREGMLKYDYWREFTMGRTRDRIPYFMPDAEKWVKRAYESFYFRPGYIFKKLTHIRSWGDFVKGLRAFCGIIQIK